MRRFEPDRKALTRAERTLQKEAEIPGITDLKTFLKARFQVACAAIGEPQLLDNHDNVKMWRQMRESEASQGQHGRSPVHSDVPMFAEHFELSRIEDNDALEARMKELLTGVTRDFDSWADERPKS